VLAPGQTPSSAEEPSGREVPAVTRDRSDGFQGLFHHYRIFAVPIIVAPATGVDVTRGLIQEERRGIRGPQRQTHMQGAQGGFTRPKKAAGQAAAAPVGVDPDRSNPPHTFSPSTVSYREADNQPGLDRLERHRIRESQRGQDIDPGPGIMLEAGSFELEYLPEVPPAGGLDDGLVRSRCHLGSGPLLGAPAEVLQQAGELHGHDELGRRALTHRLQRLEVLQGHGFLIDRLGDGKDLLQSR